MAGAVIVDGARTPVGRLLGSLTDLPATQLGGHAIQAALARAGIAPDQVQYVVMGQVLQAGAGQNPARQAAVAAGIPMTVPALTVNKVCLSGLTAVALADQLIRAGECEVVVAGGMESMTHAPHLLPDLRRGRKYGDVVVTDHLAYDGLTDVWDACSMGESTEGYGAGLGFGRAEQDAYAAASHQRAAAAQRSGAMAAEIAPVGEVTDDEGVRPDATPESLARLKPAFSADGTITAGSASPISDGAAALVVASREWVLRQVRRLRSGPAVRSGPGQGVRHGLGWLAEVGAHGMVAGPDTSLHSQPAGAIRAALKKAGMSAGELDLLEINEAFAQVVLQSVRELGVDPARVNVNGGAIALGHPIGASGARLLLTLAYELRRRGGGRGAAALCGGGGQGDALLLSVPPIKD